jgi:hypothetical protein
VGKPRSTGRESRQDETKIRRHYQQSRQEGLLEPADTEHGYQLVILL